MATRAKFKVTRIETSLHYRDTSKEVRTLVLAPVTGGSPENDAFYDATPSGEIKLGTLNPEAWAPFKLGGEFYVDFTPA